MLAIRFAGWVSCRLATDPDPFDDPRGTLSSFQQLAYAGEPDLDRVIRFQRPPFVRSHTWLFGVSVRSVALGVADQPGHPLIGAELDLLDGPVFEGRNHVIANDTQEPILPFHLQVRRGATIASRKVVPRDTSYPFPEYFPLEHPQVTPAEIAQSSGVPDLVLVWQERLAALRAEYANAAEVDKPGLEERIGMLDANLSAGGGLANVFLGAVMRWRYVLTSGITAAPDKGAAEALFGVALPDEHPWTADFWFGGFDADAQAFFCSGTLMVPGAGEQVIAAGLALAHRRGFTL